MTSKSRRVILISWIYRFGLATVGPTGAAASQFLLSMQLLHTQQPALFGSYSFLLVTSQLSLGVWSALFCAPLPFLVTQKNEAEGQVMLRSLLATNFSLAVLAFPAFLIIGISLGVPATAAAVFASYGSVALVRWFARAYAFTTGQPLRTAASDILYSITLISGVIAIALLRSSSLSLPYGAMLVGTVIGLLPFGSRYLLQQFIYPAARDVRHYAEVWRHYSRWSLTGVVTTEATTNAHAYIVTLFLGPTAFAPLAASALTIRPLSVLLNALGEFERPRMAHQIGLGQIASVLRSVRSLRLTVIAAWIVTVLAAGLLTIYAPRLFFPSYYDSGYLAAGEALWMIVIGMRVLLTPESTMLQAAGEFRWLAHASIISSGVSIAAVAIFLAAGGPLWSIAGLFIGYAVLAAWIWRQALRWRGARSC